MVCCNVSRIHWFISVLKKWREREREHNKRESITRERERTREKERERYTDILGYEDAFYIF